ncbi:Cohesin subunit SA-3 [Rhynchospora pubera]|uniref:Cohesin subunit SA-3 n=1 Tax=Rhynchospora pubera TaxID=906938 RepID=A0AAV8EX24_9POAL|nr:Cohesin subunit SA-3 [Rhynchospora pubera]
MRGIEIERGGCGLICFKKRGRVLEQEGAEPSKSTRSPDDLFNDDDNDFVLKTKRKRGAAARTAGWSDDQPLIDAIKHNRKVISRAVKKWVEKYEADPKSALIDLLMMLFEACGAKYRLDLEIIDDVSVDDVVMSLVDLARNGLVEDYYNSKQKELKNFKDNLGAFWEDLVLECQEGPLFDKAVFEKCVDYVIALSCTPPRVYRQVATLVGLQIVTTYISVGKTLIQQRETTQRQLNAEKKKGNDGPRVESLNRRLQVTHEKITALEEMMRKVFTGLFIHRYRDTEPEIRMSSIKALGVWIVNYPSLFLQDSYLKYLGWTLNDKNALVRKTSVLALQSIYEIDDNIPSLSLFTKRFSERMLQMADDIDISVAVSAIGLLKLLLRHQLLTDDELGPLYDLLIDEPPMIRRAIGELVYDHLIAQTIKNSQSGSKDSDGEPSEVHISRLLQILREFSDDPVLSAYVIDDIWDDMKAAKDWKCIISILNDDEELADIDGTNLVRLLNASAKKAVGDRIVPAIDNRKQYLSKAQKEAFENNRKELTSAMLKSYPQLLRKYVADKAKVSPLIDMLPLLKLEMYSLKRQEQNFKALMDLISDAFFKHSEKATLRSCIKAIVFCSIEGPADLQDYTQSKLNDLESELVSKLKNAIKEVEAGDDEYSLLVNLKRLYELQLTKPVLSEGLFEDMAGILGSLPEMENEVKSFLLLNMYLNVVWSLHAIDGDNPDEAFMEALLSKRNMLFQQLYSFTETLLEAQSEGRSTSVLSCRVCIITAEIWCYFKNEKFFSTKLQYLGYTPDLPIVQNFWKLCEGQLFLSDETEDEEANQEYIEETNRDTVMIAAAKLVATNTIPKGYLGPEIISHITLHGASTTEIIKHLITSLKKTSTEEIPFIFLEALKLSYHRYRSSIARGNQLEIGRSLSDCKELASRLSGAFVGAAITKNKSEIIKIVMDGIEFAFSDAPDLLTFLELALVPFVSKLPSADVLDILKDVEVKIKNFNMNENPTAWNPYNNFVAFLHEKYSKNETIPDVEEKPVRRRGRPRKARDAPPAKKLFEEPGALSEEEEDPISGSDTEAQYQQEDDVEADQLLIHTIRSATKLRGMRVQNQHSSSQPSFSRKSGSNA